MERTLSSGVMQKLNFVGLFVLVAGILVLALMITLLVKSTSPASELSSSHQNTGFYLMSEDFDYLDKKAREATTTNEKVEFLFELQSRQLERITSRQRTDVIHIGPLLTWKNSFIILPLLITLICIGYLGERCYPAAVFLWGDYEEHYNKILSRRKTIWNVIVISLGISILGSLFAVGVSSHL